MRDDSALVAVVMALIGGVVALAAVGMSCGGVMSNEKTNEPHGRSDGMTDEEMQDEAKPLEQRTDDVYGVVSPYQHAAVPGGALVLYRQTEAGREAMDLLANGGPVQVYTVSSDAYGFRAAESLYGARRHALLDAAGDICDWCGGRHDPTEPSRHEAHGPDGYGNYYHVTDYGTSICQATEIHMRIQRESQGGVR